MLKRCSASHKNFICLILQFIFFTLAAVEAPADGLAGCDSASALSLQALSADDLMKKANTAFGRGDFVAAIDQWDAAEKLYQADQNIKKIIDISCRTAEAYRVMGHHQLAEENLRSALTPAQNQQNPLWAARVHLGLGQLYLSQGRTEPAGAHLRNALMSAKDAKNRQLTASVLTAMGNMLTVQQDYDGAVDAYKKSDDLFQQINRPVSQLKNMINMAKIHYIQKNYQNALTLLKDAKNSAEHLPDSHDKAFCLIAIAKQMVKLQAFHTVLDHRREEIILMAHDTLNTAKQVAMNLDDMTALSHALGYMGHLYEKSRRYNEALQLTRQALFAAQKADIKQVLYQWQWQTGRLLKAQGHMDRAIEAYRRTINTLDIIRDDISVHCNQNRQLSFREVVGPVYFELADLLLRRSALNRGSKQSKDDLREARDTIEQLKAVELQDYFQDECITSLESTEFNLDKHFKQTAIFYPILLPDRMEILVTLPDGLRQETIPIDANTIAKQIKGFRQQLESPLSGDYMASAKQLYRRLIHPLEKQLAEQHITTLVFIPDGALRTIPMAALHDGEKFLVEKYAVAVTPGLTFTALTRPAPEKNSRLMLSGLTEGVQGFPALPNVDFELDALQTLYPCDVFKNQTFTLSNVQDIFRKKPYSVVHIASHGQFNRDHNKTFLLTYDNRLTMDMLEDLMRIRKLKKEPVELLTLSACQTAVGDDRAALGLAGIAIRSGALSALASLWFIDDRATSLLVTEFYKKFQTPSFSKARALQIAQNRLIHDSRYSHPFYWAPFLLIGNWL
ncbi:CHAT domain-containing protein [Desulfobacter latus]|uniref:CHAT domain-containing protein n=1 Tax=Desulfobacter latus TaxID=2292 RepID=A0A850SVK8_9BACT|nr:CHAT domain-containing protein [Desulfobacter latus]NWH03463.1 CHAT domain-containing protein [Desulfobacter latus]